MAPSHLKDALNVRPRNVDVSCLKFITVGGSSLSKEQLLYLRKELPDVKYCSVYGETEATGILTLTGHSLDEKLAEEKAASCGQPQKGVCYKVIICFFWFIHGVFFMTTNVLISHAVVIGVQK